MLREYGFDLSQFDAKSPQLDLIVDSSEVLNLAIDPEAGEVSRATARSTGSASAAAVTSAGPGG